MMPTSTILLIDEIVNYMYKRDLKSLWYGYNWVFRGLTSRNVSCSLVFILWNRSRSQWYPLASGSSSFLPAPQKSRSGKALSKRSPISLFLSSLYMRESVDATFCPLVMMTSQSSLPFACSTVPSVSCSHICCSVYLASDFELIGDVCLQYCTS